MSEEKKEEKEEGSEMGGMAAKMLQSRTIVISGQVDGELAAKVMNQVIVLEQDDPEKGITVFINSPGGEMFSGFAIFDLFKFISCPVTTIVAGFAASMGSILSLAADEGRRFILPSAKVLIHQPLLMGYQGRATDCEIQAEEILKARETVIELYCKSTGRGYEEIKEAIDRDNWFTASEALDYGLVDGIITSRSELNQ